MSLRRAQEWMLGHLRRGAIPAVPLTIVLAGLVGVLAGYGSVLFTWLIGWVNSLNVEPVVQQAVDAGR